MYIKHGNTFIVEKMSEIPVKELKPGTQVTLTESIYHDYLDREFDKTTNMFLNAINCGHLYLFDCTVLQPDIGFKEIKPDNDDEEYKYEYEPCCYQTYDHEQAYIITKDICFPLIKKPEKRDRVECYLRNLDEVKDEDAERISYRSYYKDLFINNDSEYPHYGRYYDKNMIDWYLALPLNKDCYILFIIDNHVNPDTLSWIVHKNVVMMHRDKSFVEIECDWYELFELFKTNDFVNTYSFKEFKENALAVINYDVKDYLRDDSPTHRDMMLDKIVHLFLFSDLKYGEIRKFYCPIYTDKENKFEAYINTARGYNQDGLIYMIDGKAMKYWDIQKLDHTNPLYNPIRIARQIYKYISSAGNAVHYISGELHKGGENATESGYNKLIYATWNCVWIKYDNRQEHYYVRVGSYMALGDEKNPNDLPFIEEMKQSKALSEKLAEYA